MPMSDDGACKTFNILAGERQGDLAAQIPGVRPRMLVSEQVIFSLTLSEKGHPRATSVRLVGQARAVQVCACSQVLQDAALAPGRSSLSQWQVVLEV